MSSVRSVLWFVAVALARSSMSLGYIELHVYPVSGRYTRVLRSGLIGWRTAPILRQTRLDGREPRRNCSVGDQRSQLTALNGRNGLTMLPHPSQHPLTPSTPHNLTFAPLLRLTRLWPKPTLAGPAPQRATQCRVRVSGPPMSSRSDRPTECFKARF